MRRQLLPRLLGVVLVSLLMIGGGWSAAAQDQDATPEGPVAAGQDGSPVAGATPVSAGASDAEDYCLSVDGILQLRYPVWGTNLPVEEWITTGPPRLFCEFTGTEEADPPSSWIAVDLQTLYAETPTLAALAYLTSPPLPTDMPLSTNASGVYCRHLGGSIEFGGATGAGGGWITLDTATPVNPLAACVFPDGSVIDDWGLAYHTMGTIRGADLTFRLRYQADDPPLVFVGQ